MNINCELGITAQVTSNFVLKINYNVWLWHQHSCSSNHYSFHWTHNIYLQYTYYYMLHTDNVLFKVPWRWSCNIFSKVLENFYQSTWHHILEHVFFSNTNQNLKSHIHFITLFYIYMYIKTHTHHQQIINLLCCHNP